MTEFLRTHDIFSRLNLMLREARKFIVIVSPFIVLDGEQQMLLKKAADNDVPITIIYRLDSTETAERLKGLSDFQGIKIIGCPELHAKIYATEAAAIMGSKNLTTRKYDCSIEIGLFFDRNEEYYNSLYETAAELAAIPDSQILVDNSAERLSNHLGYCIRCGKQLNRLSECAPLCKECYDDWLQSRDKDHEESYCHFCGKKAVGITFRHPIESDCYLKYTKAAFLQSWW